MKSKTRGPDTRRPAICIIGLGLIGASLAAAWRRSDAAVVAIGIDPDAVARRVVVEQGIVGEAYADLPGKLDGIDLVVLAAPVDAVLAMAQRVAEAVAPGAVVTDVCSVKRPIVERYEACLRGRAAFVGGHPMAGSERQGPQASDPLLFENAAYVLTPTPRTEPEALAFVEDMVRMLGAHPVRLDPVAHDRAVASVSHLPQVVASALMLAVGQERIPTEKGEISPVILAGGGLRDTTRIAASPARLWRDILLANADEILRQLDAFEAALRGIRAALQARDGEALTALFREAAALREGVRARQRDLLPRWPELTVRIADQPGALAEVTGVLARAGMNIADVEIVRTREGVAGALRIALASRENAARAVEILTQAGFEVTLR